MNDPSLVVPAVTTTVLPRRSRSDRQGAERRTRSLVPATKMIGEKSTSLRRAALLVVEPHSMSTSPFTTVVRRSAGETGRYSTRIVRPPSSAATSLAIALQRSIE